MSGAVSAGILLYRRRGAGIEVLIAHPGGPFWARRDRGAWSIPKGEPETGEPLLDAACREFAEETGATVDTGALLALGSVRQRSGKEVHAWAAEGEYEPSQLRANSFELEWPPRSGQIGSFPEIDQVAWVAPEVAVEKLNPAQAELVLRLGRHLAIP